MLGNPKTISIAQSNQLLKQLAWYEHAWANEQHLIWRWQRQNNQLDIRNEFSDTSHTPDMDEWLKLVHPEDQASLKLKFKSHLKQQAPLNHTFRFGTKEHGWAWVRVTSTHIEPVHQGTLISVGLMENVDQELLTDQLLKTTEAHFDHVLKTAKCGFWVWNMQTDSVDVRFHSQHPGQSQKIITNSFNEIRAGIFAQDLDDFDAAIKRYRNGEKGIIEGHWRIQSQVKGYRWVLNRGEVIEHDDQGIPTLAMGTHIDITQQKEIELSLKHKTELLNLANENTLNCLWDWNVQNQNLYISPNWIRSMGFGPNHELKMTELTSLIHPEDQKLMTQVTHALLKGEVENLQLEYRIKLETVGWIWVLVRGHVAERDANQRATRVVGTIADISTLKLQAMRLEHKEEQLELAMVGSNNSLFDYDIRTGNYQIKAYSSDEAGTHEKVYHFSNNRILANLHPDDIDTFHEYIKSFNTQEQNIRTTRWRMQDQGGEHRWMETKGRVAEWDDDDQPIRIVGTLQDIHEQLLAEQQANLEHQRLQDAFKGTGDAVWDMDIQNGTVFISPSWIESMGYTSQYWRPDMQHWAKLMHPEDRPAAKVALQAHYAGKAANYVAEYRVNTKDGKWLWVLARGRVIERDDQDNPLRAVGTLFNISQRKKIESKLASAKELAETTLHSIADAVITTNHKGRVISVNKRAEKLIAQSSDAVVDQLLEEVFQLIDEDNQDKIDNPALFCISADLTIELENNILLKNKLGDLYAVHCKASPIHGSDKKPIGAVLIMQDVTASRDLSREIEHRSKHDPLTNLINRYEFEFRLKQLIESSGHESHALCYLDLDQFKVVNDTCGHTAGDELLRQLSAELTRVVRQSDSLARLGGDEFALLMENCSLEQALRVAENIHAAVSDFSFGWEDNHFKLGVSIGLVAIDEHSNPQLVLQHADSACFVAKDQGRNRIHIHQEGDDQIAARQGEMGWIPRIQRALDQDHFVLYAQALVDLQKPDTPISHFELLLRMQDNDQTIPPGAFLPAAERYNLSSKLDQWVIKHTLRMLKNTFKGAVAPVDFNINLSANSLNEPGFLEFVQSQIAESEVMPSNLCFEITETAAISNLTSASHFIDSLTRMGCSFALDDFGSGLSSFAYLKNFPVDILKIDGGFVKDLVDDPLDEAMVKSINEIGHIMNKKTVAEWVENQAIADRLTAMGVNYAQGYHFSVPEPFDQALLKFKASTS